MASAPLALTTGGAERPRNVLSLGVMMLVASGTMLFGGLLSAYLRLRTTTGVWPPKGVKYDEYLGNTMAITMVLSAVTMAWAVAAVNRDLRRQACTALSMTVFFGLSVLNLLSYAASRTKFDASSHPYGLVVTALAMVLAITIAVAVGWSTLTLFRVSGRQLTAATDHVRANAAFWFFTVAASLAVWYTVIVMK